jgi:hypothetical protein
MDFGTAALFFAVGLGAALFFRNLSKSGRGGTGTEDLPMRDGSVRLDHMLGTPRPDRREGEEAGDLAGSSTTDVPLEPVAPVAPAALEEDDSPKPKRTRPRRRKR